MTIFEKLKAKVKNTMTKPVEEPIAEPKDFDTDMFVKTWCNAGPVMLLTDNGDLATVFNVYEPGMAYILRDFLQTQKATIKFIGSNNTNKPSYEEYCKYVALPLAYALLYPEKPFSKRVLATRNMFVHKQEKGSWAINYYVQQKSPNTK